MQERTEGDLLCIDHLAKLERLRFFCEGIVDLGLQRFDRQLQGTQDPV